MSINKSNIIALVVGVILGAVFFGGSRGSSDAPAPTGSDSPPDARTSYTVEMSDASNSKAMDLSGDYQVDWEIVKGGCPDGSVNVSLRSAWEEYDYLETTFNAVGDTSGTSYFYALETGNYYLQANSGWQTQCSWKATFTPIVP